MKITADDIIKLRPCPDYEHDQIQKIIGDGLSPLELCNLKDIPAEDRLWVLFQVVSKDVVKKALHRTVRRAVENHALHCGVDEVEKWASEYLAGDASAVSAESTVSAASAASAESTVSAASAARAESTVSAASAASAAWAASAASAESAERELQIQDFIAELERTDKDATTDDTN